METSNKIVKVNKLKDLAGNIPCVLSEGRFSKKHKEWIKDVKKTLTEIEGKPSSKVKEFAKLDFTFHTSSIYNDNSAVMLENLDKTEFEMQMKMAEKIINEVINNLA